MTDDHSALPYRPCAGVMLVNADRRVFVGQRIDSAPGSEAWQMPQGGIDKGEEAVDAALRELQEETGVAPHLVSVLAQSGQELFYDLPDHLMGRMWGGRYRGQRQWWFLLQFHGSDSDIDIGTEHQEFRTWQWVDPDRLVDLIVPFKRELYDRIVREFSPYLR